MNALTLAVVQFTPERGKKEENLSRIQRLMDGQKADIIVLPELCATGYFFLGRDEVDEVAEPALGPTRGFLRAMAERHGAVVIAGFAERDGDNLYNSCLIEVPEQRDPYVYRKTHLFFKERYCFDPGDTGFFVVHDRARDVRIGPMICYDWRFPESARVLTVLGADLIVCPSNLITEAWRVVMPARAIENKVYVAVANRAGSEQRGDEKLLFKGNSTVYSYTGQELHGAGPTADEVVQAVIYPEKTRDKSFNAINDVLKDRQPHHYEPITRQ